MPILREVAAVPPGVQTHIPASLVPCGDSIYCCAQGAVMKYVKRPLFQLQKVAQVPSTILTALDAHGGVVVAASADCRVRVFDGNLDPQRELLLARPDAPASVRVHPHVEQMVLALYHEREDLGLPGELRAVHAVTGASQTLITAIPKPYDMAVSPHRSEIAIISDDGMIRIYGIGKSGAVTYERFVLTSGLRVFDEQGAEGLIDTKSSLSEKNLKLLTKILREKQNS